MEGLEQRLGRSPTEEEMAEWMGVSEGELASLLVEAAPVTLLPPEELLSLAEQMEGHRYWAKEQWEALLDDLAGAIENLPERERWVITLYFYENFTLRAIAEVLNITEGRACQLKTQALFRLRLALRRAGWACPRET